MTDAISEAEYRRHRNELAERLADDAIQSVDEGEFDTTHAAVLELASDEVEYDNWFARDYYGGSLYGSIVEHCEADPSTYSDWSSLIESASPRTTLKRLAYVVFEADVIERADELAEARA